MVTRPTGDLGLPPRGISHMPWTPPAGGHVCWAPFSSACPDCHEYGNTEKGNRYLQDRAAHKKYGTPIWLTAKVYRRAGRLTREDDEKTTAAAAAATEAKMQRKRRIGRNTTKSDNFRRSSRANNLYSRIIDLRAADSSLLITASASDYSSG
ncbi:hypothetical protein PG994_008517 [Apiospora phragmitis]|uniref:Uncharacterized protein n=1 Tax=Apiospora phragmitis TaxID=2905665 RepID=A0ABR1UJQ3_9PEZI